MQTTHYSLKNHSTLNTVHYCTLYSTHKMTLSLRSFQPQQQQRATSAARLNQCNHRPPTAAQLLSAQHHTTQPCCSLLNPYQCSSVFNTVQNCSELLSARHYSTLLKTGQCSHYSVLNTAQNRLTRINTDKQYSKPLKTNKTILKLSLIKMSWFERRDREVTFQIVLPKYKWKVKVQSQPNTYILYPNMEAFLQFLFGLLGVIFRNTLHSISLE